MQQCEAVWHVNDLDNKNGSYQRTGYADEADLEVAIIEVQRDSVTYIGANRVLSRW
jgi:hypothetical protein